MAPKESSFPYHREACFPLKTLFSTFQIFRCLIYLFIYLLLPIYLKQFMNTGSIHKKKPKTLHGHGIWIISEGPNFLASCWTQSALATQCMHRRYINIISNVNGICLGFSSIDEYSQLLPSKGRISCNQFIRFPVGVAYDIVHSPRDTAWKSEHWGTDWSKIPTKRFWFM